MTAAAGKSHGNPISGKLKRAGTYCQHGLRWLVWVLGLALILATALPLIETNEWWVRLFDFPRPQIASLICAALLGAIPLLRRGGWPVRLLTGALALSLGYQVYSVLPYTPLVPLEAHSAQNCAAGDRIRLLIVNVLASNRRSELLLETVRTTRPDVLFAVETGDWWGRELSVLKSEYPYVVRQPQDNTYGLHLYSKLELIRPEVRFLLRDSVPSIKTGVQLRSGKQIDFYGMHPKPPRPGQDTDMRDKELIIVGREVREERAPAIVAGDLNDVAWSHTTRLFQEISGMLDPRVGRGLFPTYNANWPLLRWPLDHIFFERSFSVLQMQRLGDIGSDHFPISIELCHQPHVATVQDRSDAEPEDRKDVKEAVRKKRELE